jgi:hypothetical protein
MKGSGLEAFLAKIYVDSEARARFLSDPRGEADKAGLAEEEIQALENIDGVGLSLMAASLERKALAKSNSAKGKGRFLSRYFKRNR